jgi:hypothetical protein
MTKNSLNFKIGAGIILTLGVIAILVLVSSNSKTQPNEAYLGAATSTVVSNSQKPDLDATKMVQPRDPTAITANYLTMRAQLTVEALTPKPTDAPTVTPRTQMFEGVQHHPVVKREFNGDNAWISMVNGEYTVVQAGVLVNDPAQGAIYIFKGERPHYDDIGKFLTPNKVGGLKITTVDKTTLQFGLIAKNGTRFVFDMNTGKFTAGATLSVPGITPTAVNAPRITPASSTPAPSTPR